MRSAFSSDTHIGFIHTLPWTWGNSAGGTEGLNETGRVSEGLQGYPPFCAVQNGRTAARYRTMRQPALKTAHLKFRYFRILYEARPSLCHPSHNLGFLWERKDSRCARQCCGPAGHGEAAGHAVHGPCPDGHAK